MSLDDHFLGQSGGYHLDFHFQQGIDIIGVSHIHGFTAPGPFGNINVQFSQKQIISGETALSLQYPDAHLVLIVSDSVQLLRMTGGDHGVALNDGTETAVFKFAFLVFHHDFRS